MMKKKEDRRDEEGGWGVGGVGGGERIMMLVLSVLSPRAKVFDDFRNFWVFDSKNGEREKTHLVKNSISSCWFCYWVANLSRNSMFLLFGCLCPCCFRTIVFLELFLFVLLLAQGHAPKRPCCSEKHDWHFLSKMWFMMFLGLIDSVFWYFYESIFWNMKRLKTNFWKTSFGKLVFENSIFENLVFQKSRRNLQHAFLQGFGFRTSS